MDSFGVLIYLLVQMHKKHLGHEYLSDLQTNLCYLLNARMKKLLSNTVELKMKYLRGEVWMENLMNGQFKSE